MTAPIHPQQSSSESDALARDALAREIAERWTGMPAYLVSDETWAAASAEAKATYVPPKPLSPLQDAIRKAEGKHLTGEEIEQSIGFLNDTARAIRKTGLRRPEEAS